MGGDSEWARDINSMGEMVNGRDINNMGKR